MNEMVESSTYHRRAFVSGLHAIRTFTSVLGHFLLTWQILHWNFTPAMMEGRIVRDASGIGESTAGVANDALLSEHGSSLVQASPSLNPGYPCGSVYSGVWRFAAPDHYVAALRNPLAYGGRLHFRWQITFSSAHKRISKYCACLS